MIIEQASRRAGRQDPADVILETAVLTTDTVKAPSLSFRARLALLCEVLALTPGTWGLWARKQKIRKQIPTSFLSQEVARLLLFGLTTATTIWPKAMPSAQCIENRVSAVLPVAPVRNHVGDEAQDIR